MIIRTTLLTLALSLFSLASFAQSFSEYRSVPLTATEASSGIQLQWTLDGDATAYEVYRRSPGETSWGSALATLADSINIYTDVSASNNTKYEYRVTKKSSITHPLSQSGAKIEGQGYVTAAAHLDAVHSRGVIWVLIAKNINDSLSDDIEQLRSDLAGDGWDVYSEVVNPGASVGDVKGLIDMQRSSARGLDAIYLLGHIPVPYSGSYCESSSYAYPPDGHNESDANSHCGAWPADVYYATDTTGWTDLVSLSAAKDARREKNKNNAGDGKFDNNFIPNIATIQVGRVDMDSLDVNALDEYALTKRYLDKAHAFKMAQTTTNNRAVIDNNFAGYAEGFASGARRDFTAQLGFSGIDYADMFTSNENDNYLLGFAAGAGWYTSCNGIGNTGDFDTSSVAMFNQIFGSFFGDWDVPNNFMRASIATEKNGLTCVWSGRPKWLSHPLAIGETFGQVAMQSQNHGAINGFNDYEGGYYQSSPHVALLGDPSLRTSMIAPVSDVSLTANADSTAVDVAWTASTEAGITGYYVYRSHRSHGGFELVNTSPISGTTFTDNNPWDGTNWYMVRTEKLTTTMSGSYYNLSIGERAEINGMTGGFASDVPLQTKDIKVYPTLVADQVIIENPNATNVTYTITNPLGKIVASGQSKGEVTHVNVSDLASGFYFVSSGTFTTKIMKY